MLKPNEPIRTGDKVTGVYCFEPYTGSLVGVRPTGRGSAAIFTVELEEPVIVFGQERTQIEIWTNGNDIMNRAEEEQDHVAL